MLRSTAPLLAALTILGPAGCGPSASQADDAASSPASAPAPAPAAALTTTPQDALSTMLSLAQAGNWGQFVDEFYGEQSKFSGPADRDALVRRFEDAWGDRTLDGLRRASDLEPQITDDGRAEFSDGTSPVLVLYPDGHGGWCFHL